MAGGKETPRQKMIGMMYLVLTALLALNVSKSILDAFVSIEENMQTSNLTQLFRGDEKKSELKEVSTDKSNVQRSEKAKLLLKTVKEIDQITETRIKLIDDLKIEILENIGEDVQSVGELESILMTKQGIKGIAPLRMNLANVQNKDKYDDPMRILLGDKTDIKNPEGRGMELWKSLNSYRIELTGKIAGSHIVFTGDIPEYDKNYFFKGGHINDFESQEELNRQLISEIKKNKVHSDDAEDIAEIYSILTKQERSRVNDVDDVHWLGKTFDHSPSVAAIASLTSLQNDILAARSQAVTLIRNRVTGGDYSFNKVIPLAYGQVVANRGDSIDLKIMMAAFDTDKQPRVTLDGDNSAKININNGQGTIKLKAGGSSMSLSGTVAVQKKSGQWKTEKWSHDIVVMEPSGSIELTDMNTLYRGIDNNVRATASGFDLTKLQGSGVSIIKSGEGWVVKPQGRSRTASLKVVGVNSTTGETKTLKTLSYNVRNLPKPSIYWGGANETQVPDKRARKLFARYPPEIPLNAKFEIVSWECSVGGATGPNKTGAGNDLSPAMALIAQTPRGRVVSFLCKVRYPDNKIVRVNTSFKL